MWLKGSRFHMSLRWPEGRETERLLMAFLHFGKQNVKKKKRMQFIVHTGAFIKLHLGTPQLEQFPYNISVLACDNLPQHLHFTLLHLLENGRFVFGTS